jgi:hypothetical protein
MPDVPAKKRLKKVVVNNNEPVKTLTDFNGDMKEFIQYVKKMTGRKKAFL